MPTTLRSHVHRHKRVTHVNSFLFAMTASISASALVISCSQCTVKRGVSGSLHAGVHRMRHSVEGGQSHMGIVHVVFEMAIMCHMQGGWQRVMCHAQNMCEVKKQRLLLKRAQGNSGSRRHVCTAAATSTGARRALGWHKEQWRACATHHYSNHPTPSPVFQEGPLTWCAGTRWQWRVSRRDPR